MRARNLRKTANCLEELGVDLQLTSEQRYRIAIIRDHVTQAAEELEAILAEVVAKKAKK